jgi:transposase
MTVADARQLFPDRERTLAVENSLPEAGFQNLQTVYGIGPILAMTIWLETGDIGRFHQVGDYASYCRCVASRERSADNEAR